LARVLNVAPGWATLPDMFESQTLPNPAAAASTLLIKPLSELATLPQYQTENSAGMDLHAALDEPVMIEPGEIRLIPCGFAMAVPVGYEA